MIHRNKTESRDYKIDDVYILDFGAKSFNTDKCQAQIIIPYTKRIKEKNITISTGVCFILQTPSSYWIVLSLCFPFSFIAPTYRESERGYLCTY